MKHCNNECNPCDNNIEPLLSHRPNCNRPVRRHLPPVLVAKIYNQPIVEEIPHSSMSMSLDNTATISNLHSEPLPLCSDMPCLDGRSEGRSSE